MLAQQKLTEAEWRKIGEERLKLSEQLLREIVYGTGQGDFLVQVRRDQGKIIIKPQPWFCD